MDNRGRVLEAALILFATRGYDAVGVQEICENAGVTKPTLYHYFGSKRGLLEHLVQNRCAPLIAELTQAATYTGDLQNNLHEIVETYFQFAMREPLLYRLLLAAWLTVPDNDAFQIVATLNTRQHDLVEALFRAAANNHGNMRDRHRAYAATFLGMINTYISLALNKFIVLDQMVRQQAVQQFSYGIYS